MYEPDLRLAVLAGEVGWRRYTVPASVSKAQHKKYQHSPAQTDYLEFEGRSHLFMVGEGWGEVAASIDGWLDGVLDAPAPAPDASA